MKAGTQMPRGMLMGCQHRASNLESRSIPTTVIVAAFYAAKNYFGAIAIYAVDVFREKEWWERLR